MTEQQFKMLVDLARDAGDGVTWLVFIMYFRFYLSILAYSIVVPIIALMVRNTIKHVCDRCSTSTSLLPPGKSYWTYSDIAKAKVILDKYWKGE